MLNSPLQNLPGREERFSHRASILSAPYYPNTVYSVTGFKLALFNLIIVLEPCPGSLYSSTQHIFIQLLF